MGKLTRIVAPAHFATLAIGALAPAPAAPRPHRAGTFRRQIADLQTGMVGNDYRRRVSPREAGLRSDVARLKGRSDTLGARLEVERHDRDDHRWQPAPGGEAQSASGGMAGRPFTLVFRGRRA
jgi:hypothetical protein